MALYKGTSTNGDFQEALKLAIDAAHGSGAEQVQWTLVKVSGVHGGFRPQNDLTVEIEA